MPLRPHEASAAFCPIFFPASFSIHLQLTAFCILPLAFTRASFYSSLQYLTHTFSPQPLFSRLFCKLHHFCFYLHAGLPQVSTLSFFLVYPFFLHELIYLQGFSPSLYRSGYFQTHIYCPDLFSDS